MRVYTVVRVLCDACVLSVFGSLSLSLSFSLTLISLSHACSLILSFSLISSHQVPPSLSLILSSNFLANTKRGSLLHKESVTQRENARKKKGTEENGKKRMEENERESKNMKEIDRDWKNDEKKDSVTCIQAEQGLWSKFLPYNPRRLAAMY